MKARERGRAEEVGRNLTNVDDVLWLRRATGILIPLRLGPVRHRRHSRGNPYEIANVLTDWTRTAAVLNPPVLRFCGRSSPGYTRGGSIEVRYVLTQLGGRGRAHCLTTFAVPNSLHVLQRCEAPSRIGYNAIKVSRLLTTVQAMGRRVACITCPEGPNIRRSSSPSYTGGDTVGVARPLAKRLGDSGTRSAPETAKERHD